jgi:hypothetical protein
MGVESRDHMLKNNYGCAKLGHFKNEDIRKEL